MSTSEDQATFWSVGLWAVFGLAPVLPWTKWLCDSALASWVQAFGSIAAILATIWVVNRSHALQAGLLAEEAGRARAAEAEAHQRRRTRSLAQWEGSLSHAAQICRLAIDLISRQADEAEFVRARERLKTVAQQLQRLDLQVLVDFDEQSNIIEGVGEIAAMCAQIDMYLAVPMKSEAVKSAFVGKFEFSATQIDAFGRGVGMAPREIF